MNTWEDFPTIWEDFQILALAQDLENSSGLQEFPIAWGISPVLEVSPGPDKLSEELGNSLGMISNMPEEFIGQWESTWQDIYRRPILGPMEAPQPKSCQVDFHWPDTGDGQITHDLEIRGIHDSMISERTHWESTSVF